MGQANQMKSIKTCGGSLKSAPEEADVVKSAAVAVVEKLPVAANPDPAPEVIVGKVTEPVPGRGKVKLTSKEADELKKQEAIVEACEGELWKRAEALTVIHDGKLYKGTHKRFGDYCLDRWGFDRSQADRNLNALRVYKNLKSPHLGVVSLPVTEAQTRPLGKLSPDQQGLAWKNAVKLAGEDRVTMAHVEKAVEDLLNVDRGELIRRLKPLYALLVNSNDAAVVKFLKELAVFAGILEPDDVVEEAVAEVGSVKKEKN